MTNSWRMVWNGQLFHICMVWGPNTVTFHCTKLKSLTYLQSMRCHGQICCSRGVQMLQSYIEVWMASLALWLTPQVLPVVDCGLKLPKPDINWGESLLAPVRHSDSFPRCWCRSETSRQHILHAATSSVHPCTANAYQGPLYWCCQGWFRHFNALTYICTIKDFHIIREYPSLQMKICACGSTVWQISTHARDDACPAFSTSAFL